MRRALVTGTRPAVRGNVRSDQVLAARPLLCRASPTPRLVALEAKPIPGAAQGTPPNHAAFAAPTDPRLCRTRTRTAHPDQQYLDLGEQAQSELENAAGHAFGH